MRSRLEKRSELLGAKMFLSVINFVASAAAGEYCRQSPNQKSYVFLFRGEHDLVSGEGGRGEGVFPE